MKNIIWKDIWDKYIITNLIGEIDSLIAKDKIIANGDANGLTFIGVDYTQEQIDGLMVSQNLQEAKNAKISEAKFACEVFRTLPLTVEGKTYKATDNAKSKFWIKINGSVTSDFPITWLESDDVSFVLLTKIQATTLYNAFEDQDLSAYQQRAIYLNQINAISSDENYQDENGDPITALEALNNITINFE